MSKKHDFKYPELLRYVFFGALTTAVSLGVYFLCTGTFLDPKDPLQLQLANVLSWIAAVSFAYVTNRRFVFGSRNRNVLKEAAAFFLSRLGTLGVDMGLMFLGCTVLKLDDRLMKLFVQAVILAANYLLSKFLVFRAGGERLAPGKRSGLYGYYTLLFAAISAAVFLPFALCGKNLIWIDTFSQDGLYQHFNVFIYLGQYGRQILRTLLQEHRLVLPMWDFAIGMGGDVITTLSYYGLGDPFSLLTLFFRPETAEYGYTLAILLRMYCAGLAFITYSKKMECSRTGILCGAIAYVFSSFLLFAAVRHPLFTNALIWLPLLYLGIEKLLKRESPAVYILSVAVAALSSFYFFYMIALMTAIYVLLRGFEAVGRKPGALVLLALKVAGLSLTGIAIASAIFLPSIFAFAGSSRHTDAYRFAPFYTLREYLNYPKTMISTQSATLWAFIGVAPTALLCTALEFLRPRRERWTRIQFSLYILFLLFPVFGYIFNGFGYVTNRWVFGYVLLVCFLLAKNLDGHPLSRREKLLLCVVAGAYAAVILLTARLSENASVTFSLLLLLILALCLACERTLSGLFAKRSVPWRRIWITGVISLTAISVSFNGFYRNSPRFRNYAAEFCDAGSALSHLEGGDFRALAQIDDASFYRIDSGRCGHINYNFPLHRGVSTTSVYWSILPKYYSDYMVHVNAYDRMLDDFPGMQSRAMLLPFAAAKYYVTSAENRTQTPYGFAETGRFLTESGEERVLYRNGNVLPLGYTYDRCIPQEAYLRMTPVQRQQAMLYGAVLPDGAAAESGLPAAVPVYTDHELPFTLSGSESAAPEDRRITVSRSDASVTLDADCPAGEELYLILEGLTYEGSETALPVRAAAEGTAACTLTHYTAENIYAHGRTLYLFNLYSSPARRSRVTLTFALPGVYTYDRMALVSQPMTGFGQALDALRQDVLENVRMDANRVSGDIDLAKEKVLCLSIPYADGWRLRVDGTPAALLRVNDLYMGVILQPGQHRIELQYTTPYLRAGLALSAVGFAVFAALLLLRRKQKHTPAEE